VLLVTAGLTAFYSFRLVALIFHGEDRYTLFGIHPHEAYKFMLWAMSPLLVLAVIAGSMQHTFFEMVEEVLHAMHYHIHSHFTLWVMIIGTQAFVIASIFYAYKKYDSKQIKVPDGTSEVEQSFIYKLLYNQYYIPHFYNGYFIKPYTKMSAVFWKCVDIKIVDAIVDGIAKMLYNTGESTRVMQSGNLSVMLRWMVVGLISLLILAIVFGLIVRYSGVHTQAIPGLGV
jgi:NADH-quinone oxidoreductase subunit L